MNLNPHLLTRLEGIRAALVAHHQGGGALPAAAKGSERETFVRDYLRALFPPVVRFGSGAVTDRDGKSSGQLDVVIEFPFLPSFPMPGGAERLYLAESVAAVVGVKSNLAGQWEEVEASVAALRPIQRHWKGSTCLEGAGVFVSGASVSRIPYIAVGFAGHKTLDGLKQRVENTPEDRRPDAALVIDSGAFYGAGAQASGAAGLFALSYVITNCLRAVSGADTDMAAYVGAHIE